MRVAKAQKRKIRILIADDGGVFRLGLKKLFGVEDDLRVVAQADQVNQVFGLAEKFKPDVLFLQAEMLGSDPGVLITRLHQAYSKGRVIITTSAPADDAGRYIKAGAAGVIVKSVDPALFIKSVRKVMNNEIWAPKQQPPQPTPASPATPEVPVRPADTLTRREKSVISCLVQGWRNREIAQHLHITEQTVKNHLRTIYDKVGVSDRLELALYAIHKHLELPPVSPVSTETTP